VLNLDVVHTLLEDFHRLLICADDSVELSIVELSGSTVLLLPQEGGDETAIGIARSSYSFANDVPYTHTKKNCNEICRLQAVPLISVKSYIVNMKINTSKKTTTTKRK